MERRLPHGRQSLNLYKVLLQGFHMMCFTPWQLEMDEATYRAQSKGLQEFMTHPDVEGVYQRKVRRANQVRCDSKHCIRFHWTSSYSLMWDVFASL